MAADNIKVKSFRIDDETAEKFREIAAKIGGNQQDALAKLIETYEFQAGKEVLTGKKDEINQFERLTTALVRLYMASLEENLNAELTIGKQFEAQLLSKDTTIVSLQERTAKAEQDRQICQDAAKKLEEEQAEKDKRIETLQSMLSDKESLNKELQQNISDLRTRLTEAMETAKRVTPLQMDLDASRSVNRDLRREKEDLKEKLKSQQQSYEAAISALREQAEKDLQQAKAQAELTIEREKLNLEKQFQDELTKIRDEKHEEIEEYQNRIAQILQAEKNESKKEG